jgi:DNA-binding transcriptional ArsR family regulator
MAEQLLDQIHAQIRYRVRALEPAVREAEQLEAAIAALDGLAVPGPAVLASAPASAPLVRRRPASSTRRGPAKRARRGANRAAVLGVLAERSGVRASELSSAAGVTRPVLYALLKTLEEQGEIAKEQLPGGTTGYRLPLLSGDTGSGANSTGN